MGVDDPALDTSVPDDTTPEVTDTTDPTRSDTNAPEPTSPGSPTPDSPVSSDTSPPDTGAPISVPDGPVFQLDTDKPEQAYDDFIEKAINDIQRFWRAQYPDVYGSAYGELEGGVFPVYPGRTDVPGGCGMRRTTYEDVQGNAFYCGEGDFIAYDDFDLFPTVDTEIGRFALAVALSHEWGHAIQQRASVEGDTILLEQQADCFAGAWVRFISDGNGAFIKFNDDDLNVAMNGLILVRDSPGQVSASPDAHGSAFDRVGAFQEGWFDGAARCRDFDRDAPRTTLLPFTTGDFQTQGNAPYDDIVGLLQKGLDNVWTAALAAEGRPFTVPVIDVGGDDTASRCDDVPDNSLRVAFYCASTNTIVASDRRLRQLYATFGDNAVGIVLASAYSESVQQSLGSTLEGEPRALTSDCLTGSWTAALFPDDAVEQEVTISAGDLDEGIQTLISIGDPAADTDERGSPFEKIDAFRTGVLDGLPACIARLQG